MNKLPNEILTKIILNSKIEDIENSCKLDSDMYEYCKNNEDYLSRELFKIHLPNIKLPDGKITFVSFKILYNGLTFDEGISHYFNFNSADKITIDIFLLNNLYENDVFGNYGYTWVINDYNDNHNLVKYYLYKYISLSNKGDISTDFDVYAFWIIESLLYKGFDQEFIIDIFNKFSNKITNINPGFYDENFEQIDNDPLVKSLDKKFYDLALLLVDKYDKDNLDHYISVWIEDFITEFEEENPTELYRTDLINKLSHLISLNV